MRRRDWMPEGIIKSIEQYDFSIRMTQDHLANLRDQRRTWLQSLVNQARLKLNDNELMFDLERGWDCKESPIGVCAYSPHEDWCTFCENPSERK